MSTAQTSLPVVVFSCLGHLYTHVSMAFYFVIVLALEIDWQLPYHELIELWTLGALLLQVPLLWLAADLVGVPLVLVVMFMLMANAGALPAENMLLAAYTPANRHGLVFGLKFVLSFGVAPLAIQLVAYIAERTGEFSWLFTLLSLFALLAFTAAMWLPRPRRAELQSRTSSYKTKHCPP